jgi:hypothetical protein
MRKRPVTRGIIVAAMMMLSAASTAAQKISYDADRSTDFTTLKTFTLKDGTKSDDPRVDRHLLAAIASALTARAMTRDDSTPDVVVVTHLTFEKRKDISAWSTAPAYGPYGWGWGEGWRSTHLRIHDIAAGTLVIDVVDVARGTLAWRGIGERAVKQDPTPEALEGNIDTAVMRILRNFPPGTGSRHF